jgi:hypothetical protein
MNTVYLTYTVRISQGGALCLYILDLTGRGVVWPLTVELEYTNADKQSGKPEIFGERASERVGGSFQ